jgi:hypothetical protein
MTRKPKAKSPAERQSEAAAEAPAEQKPQDHASAGTPQDGAELDKDLLFLECLRWIRKEFTERACEESAARDDQTLATLRLEATYQLAEFLYLIAVRGLTSVEHIEKLTDLHNAYIIGLTKDPAKMARLGLTSDRLLDAMFTSDTLPRLLQNWRDKPGAIDQSNLARFLAIVMSAETCRKVVVACGAAGFLAREKSAYGTMLISTRGGLERILGRSIRDARTRMLQS